MDTTSKVMPIVDRAYRDASDTGKPRVLIIPTSPIGLPIDPVRVAGQFPFNGYLSVCTAADAINEVYDSPSAKVLRKYAREFNTLADAIDPPTPLAKAVAALKVITLDPAIRAFLEANDPKALEQAEEATKA